jgi:hypothetical protein
MASWRPDTFTDPAGGSDLTIRGFIYVNVKAGSTLASNIIWFTFQRYLGTVTARVDQSVTTVSGGSLTTSVSGTTAKLKFGPSSGTSDYDGVAYWAAHY